MNSLREAANICSDNLSRSTGARAAAIKWRLDHFPVFAPCCVCKPLPAPEVRQRRELSSLTAKLAVLCDAFRCVWIKDTAATAKLERFPGAALGQ